MASVVLCDRQAEVRPVDKPGQEGTMSARPVFAGARVLPHRSGAQTADQDLTGGCGVLGGG